MGHAIVIRPAVAADAVGIERVARRTWNATYKGIILPANQERLLGQYYSPTALEEAIAQERSWFFVATANEEVIGFAQFVLQEEGRRAQLTRIYVLPEWQRQGVGGRLLGEGLAVLMSEGVEWLLVVVEKDNAIGRRFYEKQGFCQEREFVAELPEQNLALLEYRLDVMQRAG